MGSRPFGTSAIHRWTWTHLAPTVALSLIAILPVSAEDAPNPNSGGVTPDGSPANDKKTSDGTSPPDSATAAPAPDSPPALAQQQSKAPDVVTHPPVPVQQEHTQYQYQVEAPSTSAGKVASIQRKAQMPNDVVLTTTNPYTHSTTTVPHPATGGGGGAGVTISTHKATTSTHPHLTTTLKAVGGGGGGAGVSHPASSSHPPSAVSSHLSSHSASGGLPFSIYSASHSTDALPFSIYSGSSQSTDSLPFSIVSASDAASTSVGGTTGSMSQSGLSGTPTTQTQTQTQTQTTAISHTGIISVSSISISTTTTSQTGIPTTTTSSAADKGGVNHSGISPGGVVGIVFGVLAALIIFTICICCLPRRLRQRRWGNANKASRYNVDPLIQDDAENLRSHNNPYTPNALSEFTSPVSAVVRERDSGAGAAYPNIASAAAWGLGSSAAAERHPDPYMVEPRGLLSPARAHDPFNNYTYAGGNNNNNVGFGGQQYNEITMPSPHPYTNVALERDSPPHAHAQESPPHSSSSHDTANTYPVGGHLASNSRGDDSDGVVAAALVDRRASAGYKRNSLPKRSLRQKFKYRPNSTLTEEERYEAAGTLARIESHTSRERDEAYEGIMQERGANRLRGGAPSMTHSGSSSSSLSSSSVSDPNQSPRQVVVNRISPPQLAMNIRTKAGSVYYESLEEMIQQPLSINAGTVASPPSSYGWGNRARMRGDSDAEMSRLLDLLINRSTTLPDRPPAPLHMVSEASFASSSDLHPVEGFHDDLGRSLSDGMMRGGGDEEADVMSNRTFGQDSVPSAIRGNAPKVTITPTSPMSASFKERWQRKYGRPI